MRETSTQNRTPPRWRKVALWLCMPAALAVGIYLARGHILSAWAGFLVARTHDLSIDTLILWDAERELDAAVWLCAPRAKEDDGSARPRANLTRLAAQGPIQRLLVVQWEPGRLERMGILQPKTELILAELEREGVPKERIGPLSTSFATNNWDAARQVAAWLDEHPQARVGVLRSALDSRLVEAILHDVTTGETTRRWTIVPVQPTEYAIDRWWTKEPGLLDVFFGSIGLAFHWLAGEPANTHWEWQPAEWLSAGHRSEVMARP